MKRMRLLSMLSKTGGSNQPRKVELAEAPQPEVLAHIMNEAGVKHGQTFRGNLRNVRIASQLDTGKVNPQLYFCPMKGFEITKIIDVATDNQPVPRKVTLPDRLLADIPIRSGYYDITGLQFYSNGSIQVTATVETKFKLVEEE